MSRRAISLRIGNRITLPVWTAWAGLVAGLLILIFVASLRLSPPIYWQGRDDGIYAYVGKVIHGGGLPYRDAWDNKPPGIYYIDALAFTLFGVNRWALWLIEMISVSITSLLMAWLLFTVFERRVVALSGTLVFVMLARHPDLVPDGNFIETQAMLPQVLCFLLGYRFLRQPEHKWGFLLGLAAGLIFLVKQTAVGGALVFIPAILLSRHSVMRSPRRWTWLGVMILGGLIGLGLVALYLLANDTLVEAVDAVIVAPSVFHNWVSREPVYIWDSIYRTVFKSIAVPVIWPLSPFFVPGTVLTVRGAFERQPPDRPAENITLAIWAMLTFLTDLVLTNLTNRGYRHYYIMPVPALTLLVTFGLSVIIKVRWPKREPMALVVVAWTYLAVMVGVRPVQSTISKLSWANWNPRAPVRQDSISVFVAEHTAPDDLVLVWGASSEINFQSGRFSPTQFHYSYPLVVPTYTRAEQFKDFMNDLETNRPVMIVDAAWSDGDWVPPLGEETRQKWLDERPRRKVTNLEPLYRFVADHCVSVENDFWRVDIYRCTY